MTPAEVREWILEHNACYPNYSKWLNRQPNLPALMARLDATFRDVTLHDACEASRQMSQGGNQPKSSADHVRIVRAKCNVFSGEAKRLAKAQRYAQFGEETFECGECLDTGFRYVPLAGQILTMARQQVPLWRVKRDGPEKAATDHYAMVATKGMAVECDCRKRATQHN